MNEEFFEYVVNDIGNLNVESPEFSMKIKKLLESNEAKTIFEIKNKQKRKKLIMDYLGFIGRISTEQYWVTRGWPKDKLSQYQQENSKKAIEKGVHRGRFSKDWFIKKYGEDKGLIEYNKLKKDRSTKNKKEYQISKKGQEEWIKQLKEKKQTKDNFIKRYGVVVGEEKWNEFLDKCKYNQSLESWQERFGVEEGKKLRTKFFSATLGSGDSFSKISTKMFQDVEKIFEKNNIKYGENETTLYFGKKYIKPDFLYEKKIIEFYGDYWHANPLFYNVGDLLPMPGRKEQTVDDIWEKDKNRVKILEKNGFDVLIIWENEYKNDPQNTISKCLEFLNS